MDPYPGKGSRASRPFRLAAMLLVFALVAAMTARLSPVTAQTPTVSTGGSPVEITPESALFFAQANFDMASDQMVLAADLFERAGLDNFLEQASSEEEIPEDAQVGVIVTSIPPTADLDVAAVSVDPMETADTLEEGGFALVFTSADAQALYDAQLEDIQGNVEMSGGELVETEYEGVTITSYAPTADDEYTSPAAVALVGDYVVTGARAEDLHPIIDTHNGTVPSLTTNARYQELTGLLPAESISNGFFNGPATLAAVEASIPEALAAAGPMVSESFNSYTGFSLAAEQQGFRFLTRSIADGEGMAEITPVDGSFFDQAPDDALFATTGNEINAHGWLTVLAFVFASEMVGEDLAATPVSDMDLEAAQERVFADAERMLGFNLKTEFVDLLTGEFGITLTLSNVTAEIPTVSGLIVSQVSDPATMQDTMSRIAMIAGAGLGDQTAVAERDVNGSTVYGVDISETGASEKVEFGVVEDELVISAGTGLDDYLEGPASPLSSDPNFTAVMEQMPEEYGYATYVNMPVLIEIALGFSESMESGMSIEDADPSCGDYATQADAQAAYDADQFENYLLDQDFDGEACEDFFAADATPVASPATSNPYPNVIGLASVATQDDGVMGTDTFLMIGGE